MITSILKDQEKRKQLKNDLLLGLPHYTIAEKYGVHIRTITSWRKFFGIRTKTFRRIRQSKMEEMRQRYEEFGEVPTTISLHNQGYSWGTAYNYWKRFNAWRLATLEAARRTKA